MLLARLIVRDDAACLDRVRHQPLVHDPLRDRDLRLGERPLGLLETLAPGYRALKCNGVVQKFQHGGPRRAKNGARP